MQDVVTGTVEGTGSAINISLGFIPNYVKVYNYDDAGALAPTVEWWGGMSDGHGVKTLSIKDDGSTSNYSSQKITSGGISEYSGATTASSKGFSIGTDSDINVTDETLYYMAVR